MPTTPPFHEFAMRYPAFESVLPSRVELALADAAESITTSIPERIWRKAVMLKAAHELTLVGLGVGVEAALRAKGLGGFTSVSDGVVSASRAASSTGGLEGLSSTTYGAALAHLLRYATTPAVVATGTGAALPVLGSPHPVLRRV